MNAPVTASSNLKVDGNFTSSLQEGYVWVGDSSGTTTLVTTSSLASGGLPSGTKMLFQQTSAPTGWTKDTTHNNKALRIVNGSVGTGGSNSFTNAFNSTKTVSGTTGTSSVTISGSTQSHTLTTSQMPSHRHDGTAYYRGEGADTGSDPSGNGSTFYHENTGHTRSSSQSWIKAGVRTEYVGGGSGHSHTVNITSGSHSHSFSDTFNLNVQYVDFIIATKD